MSICAFWQVYDSVIPLILENSFNMQEVLTGVIMAADNILAVFLLPVFGSLSDRVNTPFGKRIPFIVLGTILSVAAMFFIPLADNQRNLVLFLILLGLVLLFMSFYRSPAVALMPDVTPRPLRSRGNAVINLTGTVGAIFALLAIRFLVKEGKTPDYSHLFWVLIAFMVICTVILVLTVSEKKWGEEARAEEQSVSMKEWDESETSKEKETKPGKLPFAKKRSLIFLLISVAAWYMAYNAVTSAFSRYASNVWELESGGYADCLMVATVAAVISYIPLGMLAARIGRKRSIYYGILGLTIGFCYVGLFLSYHFAVNFGFVLIGVSWAAINVNSFPMVVEIASDGDVGKYTGYYYIFSMAGQIITPVLSGALLQFVDYRTLFPYAVVFSMIAYGTMHVVRHGDVKVEKKKSLLESFDVDD